MILNKRENGAEGKEEQGNPSAHEIIRYLSKYATLSDVEAQAIIDGLDIRQYKKGEVLLREGEVAALCYFVIKGCVRQYYLVNGEERTTEFFTEGQPVAFFRGSNANKPSPYFLACLEDSICSVGLTTPPQEEFNPKLYPVCRMAAEDELSKSQETLSMYRHTNPEERYLEIFKSRPGLVERVPQYYLASYLGITPESLSRIRKRIMKKS